MTTVRDIMGDLRGRLGIYSRGVLMIWGWQPPEAMAAMKGAWCS
jgi:hypothetical protein